MADDRREKKRTTVYRAELPGTPSEVRTVEYDAVSEALHFACRDLREGRRRPLEIVEDGVVVYDADGIVQACAGRDRVAGDAAPR